MNDFRTSCDAGCGKAFNLKEFSHAKLGGGIEKTHFTCPHCLHEYVAYYTDPETRELQARIRRVQQRFADPRADHKKAALREAEIKAQIKVKMNALKKQIEEEEECRIQE